MYRNIVVGTDGSAPALDAVRRAGELAKSAGADSIHVVAACAPISFLEVERIEAGLPQEFQSLISTHLTALDRFGEARDALAGTGVTIVEHERDGDPSSAILDIAEEVGADLIVVGARGIGALQRFIRGSVSTRVAHHSACDVLIVEHRNRDAAASTA
jgi:nucleotide-binding universal stress UspA family protein